jgi:hypothetical protein
MTTESPSFTRNILALAAILLLLGLGNVLFAHQKLLYYNALFDSATTSQIEAGQEAVSKPRKKNTALSNILRQGPSLDQQTQYRMRILARKQYYETALFGGKVLLVAALFLLTLLILKKRVDESPPLEQDE